MPLGLLIANCPCVQWDNCTRKSWLLCSSSCSPVGHFIKEKNSELQLHTQKEAGICMGLSRVLRSKSEFFREIKLILLYV